MDAGRSPLLSRKTTMKRFGAHERGYQSLGHQARRRHRPAHDSRQGHQRHNAGEQQQWHQQNPTH
jgi:hypothetical protein